MQRLDSIDKKLNKLDSVPEQTASLTEFNNELTEKLDRVIEQTALLAEFKTESVQKLDTVIDSQKSVNEILGRHEVEIQTLKRKIS